MVGGFEKLAPFSFTEVFAVFVEGFDSLILNRGVLSHVDELALASLSSTSGNILHRHGNAQYFPDTGQEPW